MAKQRRWSDEDLVKAVAISHNYREVLKELGLKSSGGSHAHIKSYINTKEIDTTHFETLAERAKRCLSTPVKPLADVLVENSDYSRSSLKKRLYKEGLKTKECELCGQGEIWQGKKISLILDHINGVSDDNRINNLRIVCPNCNAGLDTHCGKNKLRQCSHCEEWNVTGSNKKFCSQECINASLKKRRLDNAKKDLHNTGNWDTPENIIADVELLGWTQAAKLRNISDNGLRKRAKIRGLNPMAIRKLPAGSKTVGILVEQGLDARGIAERTGLSRRTVSSRIREYKLSLPNKKQI